MTESRRIAVFSEPKRESTALWLETSDVRMLSTFVLALEMLVRIVPISADALDAEAALAFIEDDALRSWVALERNDAVLTPTEIGNESMPDAN